MPMRFRQIPPREEIARHFDCDFATGALRWKHSPKNGIKVGDVAGGKRATGYWMATIPGHGQLFVHRIIWMMAYGANPPGEIDHIDGNGSNNALSNLRLASSSQQKRNRGVQSNNRSGLKGAYFHACRRGKKWRSQIKVAGRLIFLGYFDTAQEAHEAHRAASIAHEGEFSVYARRKVRGISAAKPSLATLPQGGQGA